MYFVYFLLNYFDFIQVLHSSVHVYSVVFRVEYPHLLLIN